MKKLIIVILLSGGFSVFAESVDLSDKFLKNSNTVTNEKDPFLYLNVETNFVMNESIGNINGSVGYGQNLIFQKNYFGFFVE